jgi:uroporphyrinogen-III synthase
VKPPRKTNQTKRLPLAGQRILIGRAKHQASALSERVKELGAQVLEIPFIEIRKPRSYRPLDEALINIQNYDWLILTSVNGVEAVWERIQKLRLSASKLKHLKIAAIGPATKDAIEERGLQVQVVPKQYVAESVVKSLRDRVAGKRVLLARAREARDVIPSDLRKAGAIVDVVEAYETVLPKASRERLRKALRDPKRRPTIATFTSSSMARNFVALVGANAAQAAVNKGLSLASIGSITSATLRELGLPIHVEAKKFTIPGLVEALRRMPKLQS